MTKDKDNKTTKGSGRNNFIENYFVKIDNILEKITLLIKNSELFKYILKLTLLTIICASIIILVYMLLEPSIYRAGLEYDKSYVKDIFNTGDNQQDAMKIYHNELSTSEVIFYSVFDSGIKIGDAVKIHVDGYSPDTLYNRNHGSVGSNKMTVMVGMFSDGSLAGVRIMNHRETLRLTSRIDSHDYIEKFSSDGISKEVRNKVIMKDSLPQNPYEFYEIFGVDSITGATKTSMSIMEAIRKGNSLIENFRKN